MFARLKYRVLNARTDSARWRWHYPADDEGLERIAATAAALLRDSNRWVHRRVETVTFLDEASARRQLSIDFTLPSGMPAVRGAHGPSYYAPLALLEKRPLTAFDLVDESGTSLPLLTKEENGAIAAWAIVTTAERILGRRLSPTRRLRLRTDAGQITTGSAEAGLRLADELLSGRMSFGRLPRALRRDHQFASLIFDLAESFMVLVRVPADEPARRVLKLGYEQSIAALAPSSLAERLGWAGRMTWFAAPAVGDSRSYHFEFYAPGELTIANAGLVAEGPDGEELVSRTQGFRTRAHLYLEKAPVGTFGLAWVQLRVRREGFPRGAFIVGMFCALLLTAAWFRLDYLHRQSDSMRAILLVVPSLLATYLARPGEHAISTAVLFPSRIALAGAAAAMFGAAAALVAGLSECALRWTWGKLAVLVWAACLQLFVAWRAPGPGAGEAG